MVSQPRLNSQQAQDTGINYTSTKVKTSSMFIATRFSMLMEVQMLKHKELSGIRDTTVQTKDGESFFAISFQKQFLDSTRNSVSTCRDHSTSSLTFQ